MTPTVFPLENRPVIAILVRVPGQNGFAGGEYKVYRPDKCQLACSFAEKLFSLDEPDALELMGTEDIWKYPHPGHRVNNLFKSINTGEIILLANVKAGYQSGDPYRSQHGTLTAADSKVPIAFGYPGGVLSGDLDTVLAPIKQLFEAMPDPGDPVPRLEAPAIRSFFRRQ